MNLLFYDRKFNKQPAPPGITFTVEKYSHIAKGGPQEATIRAKGDPDDLVNLLNMGRYGVVIQNDRQEDVWWGMLGRVEMRYGKVTLTMDISEMYNRVAVAYTESVSGQATTGLRGTTAWAQADDSIDEFGKRELLASAGGSTSAAHAVVARDRLLARSKYPVATTVIEPDPSGVEGEALITCWGWWETLSWQYAVVPVRLAFAYEKATGNYSIGLDDADDVIAYAQSFDVGPSAWNVQDIALWLGKVGVPPGTLKVAIHVNPDDLTPGAELASVTVNASAVTDGWNIFVLAAPLLLAANTTYFLVVSTTGVNATNYYQVYADGFGGYAAGVLRKESGTTWSAAAGNLSFRLYTNNIIETSQQIRSLLTNYGQFFKRIFIEVDSAISTESYRSGDSDAQYEIEELLDIGKTGGARLLALVDPARNCRIYEEPTDSGQYFLGTDGHFYLVNNPLDDETCPVGFWCRLKGVIPATLDTSYLSGVDTFFVERSEYDALAGKLSYSLIDDVYDVGSANG